MGAVAEAVTAGLALVRAKHGDGWTLDNVWQDARADKNHPMHGLYNWDIEEAAAAHWREYTRGLVRLVRVLPEDRGIVPAVPRYIHNPEKPQGEQGYIDVMDHRDDSVVARGALLNDLQQMEYRCGRALGYAALFKTKNARAIRAGLADIQIGVKALREQIEAS